MLPRCEKGDTGEEVGIPQRNLSRSERFGDEVLPDVVLQHEVAEETIVGLANAQFGGSRAPGRNGIEVIKGDQYSAPEGDGPEEEEGQE